MLWHIMLHKTIKAKVKKYLRTQNLKYIVMQVNTKKQLACRGKVFEGQNILPNCICYFSEVRAKSHIFTLCPKADNILSPTVTPTPSRDGWWLLGDLQA